jgi:hypothetical protein
MPAAALDGITGVPRATMEFVVGQIGFEAGASWHSLVLQRYDATPYESWHVPVLQQHAATPYEVLDVASGQHTADGVSGQAHGNVWPVGLVWRGTGQAWVFYRP